MSLRSDTQPRSWKGQRADPASPGGRLREGNRGPTHTLSLHRVAPLQPRKSKISMRVTLSCGNTCASTCTSIPRFPLCKSGMKKRAVLRRLPCVVCIKMLVPLIAGVPHLVPQTGGGKKLSSPNSCSDYIIP